MYQNELYQAVKDYAQDESNFWKGCMGAVAVYALPYFMRFLAPSLMHFARGANRLAAGSH